MFQRLRESFKRNPMVYYTMSVAATWAGGQSLVVGMSTAQQQGIIPFILWAIGNTLAPIVFGLFALSIPKFQDVLESKIVNGFMMIICVFQIWLQMNNIQSMLGGTIYISNTAAIIITIAIAVAFLILFLRDSFPRNVLTDHVGWGVVYGLIAAVMVAAFICSGGKLNNLPLGNDPEMIKSGIEKAILLLPGCFAYPVFWKMLRYNDHNEDAVRSVNIKKAFVIGGLLFGLYLCFVFALAWVQFNPVLDLIKAILVTLIAVSSLSSFMYSLHCFTGKTFGTIASLATIAGWQILIPLGVLGAWTLMSTIRLYVLGAALIAALVWAYIERRRERNAQPH